MASPVVLVLPVVTWQTSPVARPSFLMQAFVQKPGGHQVKHALYCSKHCRPHFKAAFDFRGLGCLGMLAKAESGGTVSPPAEGHVRVGSRVPSAGTGMGTRPLLVSARKQGPPDPSHALEQYSGQAQSVGWVGPDPAYCLTTCAWHNTHNKQSLKPGMQAWCEMSLATLIPCPPSGL